jgi:surface polysaccharide O-acyltransferase-like enzyme
MAGKRASGVRFKEIDVVRTIAIALVVLLNSSSPVMYQIATTSVETWNVHNVADSAARV